jgi:hypothetical protein
MLLTSMIAYFTEICKRVEKPQTYGSELEQYIVSKNPTSAAEIDHWTRQFDRNQSTKGWPL